MNLCKIFGHHNMKVIRYNAAVVPKAWRGKELYVDEHDCVCFIQCDDCKRIVNGVQQETLYRTKE